MLAQPKVSKLLMFSFLTMLLFGISSCDEEPVPDPDPEDPFATLNLPNDVFNYGAISLPEYFEQNHFPPGFPGQNAAIEHDNTPLSNSITDAGATLGRVLFYDAKLSQNGTISCASCHQQEFGFSDPEVLSEGFDGGETGRHSMALGNARFYETGKFFWDERAATLEDQVLMPFQDQVEMGLTLDTLVQIVEAQAYYPILFEDAFGSEFINADRISRALAQFVRSMVAMDSKYDAGRVQVDNPLAPFPNFTQEENTGKALFFNTGNLVPPCISCHATEAFIGTLPGVPQNLSTIGSNNGLDEMSVEDLGIYNTTGILPDIGKFKVTSLRSIETTAPYMHDGRFESLGEVIDHYSDGIQDHPTLHPSLRDINGDPIKYNFDEQEKLALVAFLNTLTDDGLSQDEKYSDPFIK